MSRATWIGGAVAGTLLMFAIGILAGREPAASRAGVRRSVQPSPPHTTGVSKAYDSQTMNPPAPTPPRPPAPRSVTDALQAIRDALASGDADRIQMAQTLLARWLDENPGRAAELLALLERETDPFILNAIAEAFAQNVHALTPEIVDRFLKIAQTSDLIDRRAAAFLVLGALPNLDPAVRDSVLATARADGDDRVRILAITAVVSWMKHHPEQLPVLARGMVEAARNARDPEVRGNAIQAVALQDTPMPKDVLESMIDFARTDPSPQNRSIAVMALGATTAETRDLAIRSLEEIFAAEQNVEQRRLMLIHFIRAGGASSLDRLPVNDPRLARDIQDYKEILASGVTDPSQIFALKAQRDAERGDIPGSSEHADHNH